MREKSEVVKLLRIATFLWLAYLGVSAIIDYTLKTPGSVERFFYIADGVIVLFFIVISFWSWIQKRLGKAFLLLMIILISALPVIANQIVVRYLFSNPLPPPEAMLSRVVPFLLIALLLIAWQYKWQYMLFFILVITFLNIGILWAFTDSKSEFSGGLFAIVTQVVSFLVVGFFIRVMVGWLRNQHRSLEEANIKLKNYSQTLEDLAIIKERNRIAQELHDTLSHTLSGLSVQLETMKAYWDVDPITARKILDKSLAATHAGLDETRRILMALRAKPLDELGLLQSIRHITEDASTQACIDLELSLADNIPYLNPSIEQCFFRVAQEAITNVIKHAKAKKLIVKLESEENKVILTVQDDGAGFDVNKKYEDEHLGLLGMKERVELVNGDLSITSQLGHGTTVRLII